MSLSDEMQRLSQTWLSAHESRADALALLRRQVTAQLHSDAAQRQADAQAQRAERAAAQASLRRQVATQLHAVAAQRRDIGAMQRELLAGNAAQRRHSVAAQLGQCGAERQAQAAQRAAARQAEQARLRGATSALLAAFHHDRQQARPHAGSEHLVRTELPFQAAAQPDPAPPPAQPAPPAPTQPAPIAAATPQPGSDDLTIVWGIGPAIQQRLNQAGISTYDQLVACSPEQLRKALGEIAHLANVEQWIEQARDLAQLG